MQFFLVGFVYLVELILNLKDLRVLRAKLGPQLGILGLQLGLLLPQGGESRVLQNAGEGIRVGALCDLI